MTRKEKFDETIKELKKPGLLNDSQLNYLEMKLKIKDKWAKCLIKENFTVGISTTSRIESMHSVLSDRLNSNSRLNEVFDVFKKIEDSNISKFNEEFSRHKKNFNGQLLQCQLMIMLSKIYTPYSLKKLEPKFSKCLSYCVDELRKDREW